jgi:hypothetical protein
MDSSYTYQAPLHTHAYPLFHSIVIWVSALVAWVTEPSFKYCDSGIIIRKYFCYLLSIILLHRMYQHLGPCV